jgi:hypothetical protein
MAHYPKIFDFSGTGGGDGLKIGQNYVIVESVNTGSPNWAADRVTNGTRLLAGLSQVDALNWGTRSLDNMGSLLLMPGIYNLDDYTIEMIDYINIVGISTNRRDTIITANNMGESQLHIDFGTTSAGLQNVELIADTTNFAVMLGGDDTSFPIV